MKPIDLYAVSSRLHRFSISWCLAGVLAAMAAWVSGCASTPTRSISSKDHGEDRTWTQAKSSNTMEAYAQFLQKASAYNPHLAEAKAQLSVLTGDYLANVKEIAVSAEPETADAKDQELIDGAVKLLSSSLQREGYQIAKSDCPNHIVVSITQQKFLSGTSKAYWHFCSITEVNAVFSKDGVQLFRNKIGSMENEGKELHDYGIRVKPVEDTRETYIDPIKGTAWGAGVEFVAPESNPAVLVTEQKAFNDYDWMASVDDKAVLEEIRTELNQSSPLKITDSTEWVLNSK